MLILEQTIIEVWENTPSDVDVAMVLDAVIRARFLISQKATLDSMSALPS